MSSPIFTIWDEPQQLQFVGASGRRLARVDDLYRITGLERSAEPDLSTVATVHSGRPGISAEHAPVDLLRIVTGQEAQGRDTMVPRVPKALASAPSGVNYLVTAIAADGAPVLSGTIHVPGSERGARILDMR
ncbi:hypothetical protein [Defluviimonas salinarum]|uniref:Uncharacterized protein n=1 Tax=Defluviimonas salinarum TaxID=2992147 RepID=A0ABT3J9H7_9RHOB|nr:hypothetical protein [Defluviimonas salinarum]MCW3784331.1 hypothetical protein [Defluviimonas salinarum]